MTSHPDADAFVRAIVRDPADETARLVFADWLDEAGTIANVAWACYIRLHAEMADHRRHGTCRGGIEAEARSHAPYIHGTATVTANQFIIAHRQLEQFLPLSRFTVSLAESAIPLAVVELVPESVARDNLVLPLLVVKRQLFVAMVDSDNVGQIQRLAFILNREIVALRAERAEITDAINSHYGQTETESVTNITYESPLIGLEGDPISRTIGGVFVMAFMQHEYGRVCTGFEIAESARGCTVRLLNGTTFILVESHPREVFVRLRDHLLSLPFESEDVTDGVSSRRLDIPLLSGRRFPATLVRRSTGTVARWFRLHFRWEDAR